MNERCAVDTNTPKKVVRALLDISGSSLEGSMVGHDDLTPIIEAQNRILSALEALNKENPDRAPSFGERMADKVVEIMGSWKFLIGQAVLLVCWMVFNCLALLGFVHFDPYPFILLNLMLSFQAAFASPIILMAQNRTEKKDRHRAIEAYNTVIKIERMLEDLYDRLSRNGANS